MRAAQAMPVACGLGSPSPAGDDPKPAPKKTDAGRVVLTGRAAAQIRKLMADSTEFKYLRVRVADGEQFKLDLESQTDPKADLRGESRGVTVVVDRKSAAVLPAGIVLDYLDVNAVCAHEILGALVGPILTHYDARDAIQHDSSAAHRAGGQSRIHRAAPIDLRR